MKNTMKRIAMLTLAACMMAGGAVSSFAAGSTARILGHQTNDCEGTEKAEIVAAFDGEEYVICAECGKVNGESCLEKVDNAVANLSELYVYEGELDNGERIMTVSCLSSGYSAMSRVTASVMLPAAAVEGYDLYLVNADGAETKIDVTGDDWAHFDVKMEDGAALIRMVEQ